MKRDHALEPFAAALHGVVGWSLAAAVMTLADWKTRAPEAALSAHAIAVPVSFLLVAFVYFRREAPLPPRDAAAIFGGVVLVMDLLAGVLFAPVLDVRVIVLGVVLPALTALLCAWLAGIASTITWTRAPRR